VAVSLYSQSANGDWTFEVNRANEVVALIAARTRARVTGRPYRLVDEAGVVLEEIPAGGGVRALSRILRSGNQLPLT
jgi:hypothetical protein